MLDIELAPVDVTWAQKPKRLPTVLTREQVQAVIAALSGDSQLVTRLLYDSGLRLLEALRLRVKDLDFDYKQIIVRDGKGEQDRVTMLPQSLIEPLRQHLHRVKLLHLRDLEQGHGDVYLPYALERKYPNANREWGWQWVFPARSLSQDPRSSAIRRHHLGESSIQRAIREAAKLIGIVKPVGPHTFRQADACIRLPRICWRLIMTSAPFKSC